MAHEKVMQPLNEKNWQYFVIHIPKEDEISNAKSLGDLECLDIVENLSRIGKYLDAPKKLRLHAIGVTANLYSMIVQNSYRHIKILRRAPNNDRIIRHRPEGSIKFASFYISDPKRNGDFADKWGEFGKSWASKYKKEYNALPSMFEILEGLSQWLARQILARY